MTESERSEAERNPSTEESPGSDPAAPPANEEPPPGEDTEAQEEVTPETIAHTGKDFVEGLLASMELQAEVSTRLEDDRAVIDVTGDDLGVLIGRRGQTLDALQEVTRTAVQRRLRSRVRLLVDVEGYRSRRRESLTEYARSMAQRAMTRGTEIELEPMNAYERKLVHDAVADIEGASSYSEGEEPNRKVIVRGD
ncbi:MAG: RNA-binding cell elongation regulator Jag/EloR [Actinomycetota bacterium]